MRLHWMMYGVLSAALVLALSPAAYAQTDERRDTPDLRIDNTQLAKRPFTAHFRRTNRYGAAYAGLIRVTEEKRARDSAGRTYSESRPQPQAGVELPQGFYGAQFTDPAARTTTSWSSSKKEAVVFHPPEPRQADTVPPRSTLDDPMPDKCESQAWQRVTRLGTKTIKGLTAEGKRYTICIPAHTDKDDQPRITFAEYWDVAGLGFSVLQSLEDPYLNSYTHEMTDIEFGEPDPALFQIPAGYAVKDVYPGPQN
jgi:hypothetical protein